MASTKLTLLGGRHLAGSSTSNSDNSSNTGVIMRVLLRASLFALATSLIVTGGARAQSSQSSTAQVPVKIGYINSALLLQQAPGRAEAGARSAGEGGAYRKRPSG